MEELTHSEEQCHSGSLCCSHCPAPSAEPPPCAHLRGLPGIQPADCGSKERGQMGLQREAPGSSLSWCKEPKTKTGKRKSQATTGQKENPGVRCQGNLRKGAKGHPGLQHASPACIGVYRNASFVLRRITETREFGHLALQILRLVVTMSLKQDVFLKRREGADTQPTLTSSSVSHRCPKEGPFPPSSAKRMTLAVFLGQLANVYYHALF